MNLFDLNGDIAFVTGAGSGIGQRIAVGLAEAGADVACFDLPASAGLQDTADRISALGRRALVLKGDVTQAADLDAAVAATERDLGPLAIGLNCAGIANAAPAEVLPQALWQRMMAINLEGVFLSCQAQARAMQSSTSRRCRARSSTAA
jgi:NAD(P)-dependent dehydrogenase (short-subunit alcohol dehydrogenase family)